MDDMRPGFERRGRSFISSGMITVTVTVTITLLLVGRRDNPRRIFVQGASVVTRITVLDMRVINAFFGTCTKYMLGFPHSTWLIILFI